MVWILECFQKHKRFWNARGIDVSVSIHGEVVDGHANLDHIHLFQCQIGLQLHHSDLVYGGAGNVVKSVFAFDYTIRIVETAFRNDIAFGRTIVSEAAAANDDVKLSTLYTISLPTNSQE